MLSVEKSEAMEADPTWRSDEQWWQDEEQGDMMDQWRPQKEKTVPVKYE